MMEEEEGQSKWRQTQEERRVVRYSDDDTDVDDDCET